jgi:hypothetical protein
MRRACAEIARTLRPGAPFILESSSPMAFGHTFLSYSYPHAGPLRSGQTTPCIVTTPGGELVIQDTYWTEGDYVDAIGRAGLTVTAIGYPGRVTRPPGLPTRQPSRHALSSKPGSWPDRPPDLVPPPSGSRNGQTGPG